MIRRRGTTITGEAVGLQMLVLNLANAVECPVLDKTGLIGKYDFKLEWTPDSVSGSGPTEGQVSGPSLFAALQEQLGLRLEAQRAQAEMLVIDHVARPSEN